MTGRTHHRPMTPGDGFFAEIAGGTDPALLREAGDLAATVLVRGARESDDPALAERVVHLAESEGLETLAEVWSGAPADTLAGSLWRLFVLRSWVHADPERVAAEYDAGQRRVDVARVVAGVADPPGPDELRRMVDDVLRGIARGDFAVTLFRAAAFARIVAAGRATLGESGHEEITRMLVLSEQLEAAGHGEIADTLA
ncbi:MAG TPA: hypothetical protein VGD39_07935 [Nocardioides sp.]|jgi:hypothetical protein